MPKRYLKLTRDNMRSLEPGGRLIEHGIIYDKTKKGDGVFTINLMVDGERIKRAVGRESEGTTIRQVEEMIASLKTQAKEQRLNLSKGRKLALRFEQAAEQYLERLGQTHCPSLYKKQQLMKDHLLPFFKVKAVNQITSFEVERFKANRQETGASCATVNRMLALLSHLLNKSLEWGWIDRIPCKIRRFKEPPGRITYLTSEQVQRVLEEARKDANPFVYPFILIGLETAMRKMEILSIRIKHIDLERRVIFIPQAKAGAREQPITANLVNYLRDHLTQNTGHGQEWLFPAIGSRTGHVVAIEKPFQRVIRAAGLDPTEIVRHSLRHTAITHLVQAGVDLPTVKRISGHKTLIMVERYSHQSGAHIQAAMDKLEQRYTNEGAEKGMR